MNIAFRPVVVVHQPHFLPWLGYYNKLANADILVLQDDVQFRRRYYQNRTIIRDPQGRPCWLTVPVQASRSTLIRDVLVATPTWAARIRKSLRHSYARAPYFKHYWDAVSSSLHDNDSYIVDINQSTLQTTLSILDLQLDIQRMSRLEANGPDPTERIVGACKQLSAGGYVIGEGTGRTRHAISLIQDHGLSIYQQRFRDAFERLIVPLRPTAPNVSIVEFLFEYGAPLTRELVQHTWQIGAAS